MAGARQGFEALAARPYADVLVVGGGINGLATFRDLAMQGVDVALAERSDYVSGASAASSHMIHGGILLGCRCLSSRTVTAGSDSHRPRSTLCT